MFVLFVIFVSVMFCSAQSDNESSKLAEFKPVGDLQPASDSNFI